MIFGLNSFQFNSVFSDAWNSIKDSLSTIFSNFFQGIMGWLGKGFYCIFLGLSKILDVCQLLFYKFAGLDTVYINGQAVGGDILLTFLNSDIVKNAFFSLLILSVVLLFITTFIAVLKNTTQKEFSTSKIIGSALKSLANFLLVPVFVIIGLIVANGILGSLAAATSGGTDVIMSRQVFYAAAYNGNRARTNYENFNDDLNGYSTNVVTYSFGEDEENNTYYYQDSSGIYYFVQNSSGQYIYDSQTNHYVQKTEYDAAPYFNVLVKSPTIEGGINNFGIFVDDTTTGISSQTAADKIDNAFMNDLAIPNGYEFINNGYSFMTLNDLPSTNSSVFSVYNVNLVYLYYDLTITGFDYIIGYAAIIFLAYVFVTTIVALVKRLFECTTLFIISPLVVSMGPLDNKILGNWRTRFIASALSAYSFVVVMNIFLMLLPLVLQIQIFPSSVSLTTRGISGLLSSIGLGGLLSINLADIGYAVVNQIARIIIIVAGAVFFKEISGAVAKLFLLDDLSAITNNSFKKVAAGTAAIAGGLVGAGRLTGKIVGGGINGARDFLKNDKKSGYTHKEQIKQRANAMADKLLGEKDESGHRNMKNFMNSKGGDFLKNFATVPGLLKNAGKATKKVAGGLFGIGESVSGGKIASAFGASKGWFAKNPKTDSSQQNKDDSKQAEGKKPEFNAVTSALEYEKNKADKTRKKIKEANKIKDQAEREKTLKKLNENYSKENGRYQSLQRISNAMSNSNLSLDDIKKNKDNYRASSGDFSAIERANKRHEKELENKAKKELEEEKQKQEAQKLKDELKANESKKTKK